MDAAPVRTRRTGGHFALLHRDPVIVYAMDWELAEEESGLWTLLDALPVRRSHLLMSPSWTRVPPECKGHLLSHVERVSAAFPHVEVTVLAHSEGELEAMGELGQRLLYCSQNAFVREDVYFPIPGRQAEFDAIYDAKLADYKRHELAVGVGSLALITYVLRDSCTLDYYRRAQQALAHATWFSKPWRADSRFLSDTEVNAAYNRARVGLMLSAVEGANYASIQYLLAGLPVVTTRNIGGRDEFLDPQVARWVDDDPDAVAAAVAEFSALDLDPGMIRMHTLEKVREHRLRLLEWIRTAVAEGHGDLGRWRIGWPADLTNKLIEPSKGTDVLIPTLPAPPSDAPEVVVTDEDRVRLAREGFLVVDRPLVTREEVHVVAEMLDDVMARFDTLEAPTPQDLGDPEPEAVGPHIPEINSPSELDTRLLYTALFFRCRELAEQLLGGPVSREFDHAIYKPAHTDGVVKWHQDAAYAPAIQDDDRVHIWLALEDVSEDNGCMRFVPSSASSALLSHHRRGNRPDAHALVADKADDIDPATVVSCPLKAGMATVHLPTTLHSTGPNTTDTTRRSWIVHFIRDSG